MKLSDEMAAHWFRLPIALRVRWWVETDYGKKPPPAELRKTIDAAIKELVEVTR